MSSKIYRTKIRYDRAAQRSGVATKWAHKSKRGPTIHATLQISALGPHFAPRMTSGHRYCLVWMSSVK